MMMTLLRVGMKLSDPDLLQLLSRLYIYIYAMMMMMPTGWVGRLPSCNASGCAWRGCPIARCLYMRCLCDVYALALRLRVLDDRFFLQPAGAVNLTGLSAGCWRVDGFILFICLESISYGPALC
jgi:hypothetical protein